MFRRSDSFTSICSCSTDPPEISLEDEDINLESYQQIDSHQELGDYSIPIDPELDFPSQPTHRIVNFSLNQPKYKSLLEYWKIRNDINSHDPSESGSDFRNPIQQETEYDYQLLVLRKQFTPDMVKNQMTLKLTSSDQLGINTLEAVTGSMKRNILSLV